VIERARELVKKHEGLRLKPYQDSLGILTIGYGRNLEDRGITRQEAEHLLDNDLTVVVEELRGALSFFGALDETRQVVLVDMAFNLGIVRLMGFKLMLAAVREARWNDAAAHLLDSKYAQQVGARAVELAEMMRSGH